MLIAFDEACTCWEDKEEINRAFLGYVGNYIRSLFVAKGYIYPNQIYETLGKKWDPQDDNTPYIYLKNVCEDLQFDVYPKENNRFIIRIVPIP